jgi:hypothetical protein
MLQLWQYERVLLIGQQSNAMSKAGCWQRRMGRPPSWIAKPSRVSFGVSPYFGR